MFGMNEEVVTFWGRPCHGWGKTKEMPHLGLMLDRARACDDFPRIVTTHIYDINR